MTTLMTTVLADSWGWHRGDVGIGWWIVMMLGMIVFWGAIVALVVWALRNGIGSRQLRQERETVRMPRLDRGEMPVVERGDRVGAVALGKCDDRGVDDAER